jgi:hypothetical protein
VGLKRVFFSIKSALLLKSKARLDVMCRCATAARHDDLDAEDADRLIGTPWIPPEGAPAGDAFSELSSSHPVGSWIIGRGAAANKVFWLILQSTNWILRLELYM